MSAIPGSAAPPGSALTSGSDGAVAVGLLRRHKTSALAALATLLLVVVGTIYWSTPTEGPTSGDTQPPRLVVLPFENLSGPDDEYFADGMTDEITARMARVSGLRVIGRQTAMQYKDSGRPAREIGDELDVEYVLEGTVRMDRSADGSGQVRITPQLILASDETLVWAEPFTVDLVLAEIFEIQAEIAARIARGMDVVLLEPEQEAFAARPTDSQEAYDYYLRGKSYFDRQLRRIEDFQAAADMFERAAAADPNYVEAYWMLAETNWTLFNDFGQFDLEPRIKRAADRAIEIAPDHPAAHMAMGLYHRRVSRRYDLAEQHFLAARQAWPRDVSVLLALGTARGVLGRPDERLALYEEALELDPRSVEVLNHFIGIHRSSGRYAEADAYYERALAQRPDLPYLYFFRTLMYLAWDGNTERAGRVIEAASFGRVDFLGFALANWDFDDEQVLRIFADEFDDAIQRLALDDLVDSVTYYFAQGDVAGRAGRDAEAMAHYDSARVILERRLALGQAGFRTPNQLGLAYARLGDIEAAREMAADLTDIPTAAEIYLLIGDFDAAIDRLEQGTTERIELTGPLLALDPLWDPLRDHPRFQRLVRAGR